MDEFESVSDSELDLNRDVFDDTPVNIPRRGLQRWGTVVRRSSIGWFNSCDLTNDNSPTIAVQPEKIIELLRSPSVQTYNNLKRKLDKAKNDPEWILQFLNKDGLELLFESLEQICKRQPTNFLNEILKVSCVECVTAVMDSSLGLDYIVENKEFTRKLASALDTDNVTVKKQVYELLSALCVYSKDGYARALDALEHFKVAKKQKYRFWSIVEELRNSTNVPYKTILLEFINCIVIYTDKINERVRIRNEFYGLKLQEILNQLRREAEKDANLEVQLDVFDEHKANDDEQLPGAKGVDLNSSLDVFHAIYKQVADTPQELPFLTTLQNLLKIDPTEKISDTVWQVVETLVSKATVIESAEDSKKLLQTFTKKLDKSSDTKCTCPCHEDAERLRLKSPRRKLSSSVQFDSVEDSKPPPVPPHMTSSNRPDSSGIPPPPASFAPPPPAPPPPGGAAPPPPPPPPGSGSAPPPPPPPSGGGGLLGFFKPQKKLPQQNIPKPKTKLKTLQWQKIPVNKVMGKNNIWTIGGQLFNGYISKMDYEQIEDLFSVHKVTPSGKDEPDGAGVMEKKKKENAEVNLLDGKRSLNVNIFLKQFRMSYEEIVDLLRQGASEKFGAEKLKNLQKILPSQEEVDMFRSFDGDRAKLGSAEKFFMCLMGLPNYRLRIDGLLIKEEFKTNIEYIRPSIDSVIEAAKDIKENKNLHELLYLVLLAGNYLNAGNYAGDAAGFKLSSLLKLTETRANKPRMNLMHYVVMQAEEKNPTLLHFPEEMKFLKDASQASVENLTNDINSLDEKVNTAVTNIDSVGRDFKKQMADFLKKAVEETAELKEDLKDMESLRMELADFFCEDVKSFRLEECFKTLQTFCERFVKAKTENDQRKEHERKMEARRLQKEAEQQRKASVDVKTPDGLTPDAAEAGKGSIVEMLLADVRSGFKKFDDPSFSVTKVQKVTLENGNVQNADTEPAGDLKFIRGGTGRRSIRGKKRQPVAPDSDTSSVDSFDSKLSEDELNQRRSRRSYAVDTDDTLFDILMQPQKDSDQTPVSEGNFERIGSLRRRRQDRRQQRGGLNVDIFDRERAASPNIEAQSKEVILKERPKSDIMDDDFDYRRGSGVIIRRSRSLHERNAFSSSAAETPKISSDTFERPSRLFDTNNNKNADDKTTSPAFRSDDPTRRSARWRADIPDVKSLPIIDESARLVTPTKELLKNDVSSETKPNTHVAKPGSKDDSDISIEQKNKDKMARRFSTSTFDRKDIERVLNSATDIVEKTDELIVEKTDELPVSVSVRSKLNKRWHSDLGKADIDKVLKVIEDTGKRIDEIVKIEETASAEDISNKPDTVEESKQNFTEVENNSGEPESLKIKRKQRKQRSHLSMDDIHAAFQKKNDTPDITSDSSKEQTEKHKAPPPPKSPVVPPRRSKTNIDDSGSLTQEEKDTNERNLAVSKEAMSKAAKLAAKKRFRDQRFGDPKETPAQKAMLEHSQGRWKSNVEKESVDEAFRDYVNKNNMSRSKSYDEAVARKLMSESGDLIIPTGEKRNSLRNSSGKLFTDGRRNGRVFDDESDIENNTEGSNSPQRPSSTRSDSPKSSSSRLSIKSTNTSTETLREEANSDGESSPEQSRKNSVGKRLSEKLRAKSSSPSFSNRIIEGKDEKPVIPQLSINGDVTIANVSEASENSLSKFEQRVAFDENDDLPQAKMLKWRKKRDEKRRQSFYDNVPESGNLSPKQQFGESFKFDTNSPRSEITHGLISHKSQGSNELQNEIGSRCSYASSSDSARDEGFETMSGTVSQRTSLSSTLDSDFAPNFGKKQEQMTKLQMNENFIVANARASVKDTKIQRTESWTEAVAINADINNKDSSLDSSMEYSATSPDSGHETMKDDTWGEQSDLESTVKRKKSTSSDASDSKRPMSPASSTSSKKGKTVPSYMRSTTSSNSRVSRDSSGSDMDRSHSSSTTNVSSVKSGRLSRGYPSKTGSNTSIVSSTSTTSEAGTAHSKRRSVGTPERPSSMYSLSSRSTTPQPKSVARSTTPQPSSTPTRVASKPATHATSTVGGRSTRSVSGSPATRSTPTTTPATKTTKTKQAPPPPPAHRLKTTSLTPNRSTTPNPTRMRSQTPNPIGNRPTTPLSTRSVTPSPDTPVAPTRLKRSQSMRVSSGNRPVFGNSPGTKEAPAKTTSRPSFMEPTASSKARLSLDSSQTVEGSPPPTPPPRRSKDTDSIPNKKEEAPSPLKRHGSLRLPGRNANKSGHTPVTADKDKPAEGKIKGFMHKIGAHGSSKVRPESDCTGKLAPVAEGAEGEEQVSAANGNKSPSLRKILGLKGKDKAVKKSPESVKSDTPEKKKKITK